MVGSHLSSAASNCRYASFGALYPTAKALPVIRLIQSLPATHRTSSQPHRASWAAGKVENTERFLGLALYQVRAAVRHQQPALHKCGAQGGYKVKSNVTHPTYLHRPPLPGGRVRCPKRNLRAASCTSCMTPGHRLHVCLLHAERLGLVAMWCRARRRGRTRRGCEACRQRSRWGAWGLAAAVLARCCCCACRRVDAGQACHCCSGHARGASCPAVALWSFRVYMRMRMPMHARGQIARLLKGRTRCKHRKCMRVTAPLGCMLVCCPQHCGVLPRSPWCAAFHHDQ